MSYVQKTPLLNVRGDFIHHLKIYVVLMKYTGIQKHHLPFQMVFPETLDFRFC